MGRGGRETSAPLSFRASRGRLPARVSTVILRVAHEVAVLSRPSRVRCCARGTDRARLRLRDQRSGEHARRGNATHFDFFSAATPNDDQGRSLVPEGRRVAGPHAGRRHATAGDRSLAAQLRAVGQAGDGDERASATSSAARSRGASRTGRSTWRVTTTSGIRARDDPQLRPLADGRRTARQQRRRLRRPRPDRVPAAARVRLPAGQRSSARSSSAIATRRTTW